MNLFTLLNNHETKQVKLFLSLLKTPEGTLPVKKIKAELTYNTKTFLADFNELNLQLKKLDETAHMSLEKRNSEDYVVLKLPDDFNTFGLYASYLRESSSYQFLKYIFNTPNVSISKLSTEFYLSEASVFRRMKELNTSLKEFNIQIKSNMITGAESQIRYFSYFMRLNAQTVDDLLNTNFILPIQNFIKIMENEYGYVFSETGKIKLSLWLKITLDRFKVKNKNFSNLALTEEIAKLNHDPLYQAIRKATFAMTNQYAFQIDDNEIYLIYKFFRTQELFSVLATDIDKLKVYLNYPDPVVQSANHHFFDAMQLYYQDFWNSMGTELFNIHYYSIKQLHNKLLFFQGSFFFFHSQSISRTLDEKTLHVVKNLALNLMNENLELLHLNLPETIKDIVYRRYFDIILQIHRISANKLFIGISMHRDYSVIAGMILRLTALFDPFYKVKVEAAVPNHNYDLLISDSTYQLERYMYCKFYFLNELETPYNQQQIQNLLDLIYKEKYEK